MITLKGFIKSSQDNVENIQNKIIEYINQMQTTSQLSDVDNHILNIGVDNYEDNGYGYFVIFDPTIKMIDLSDALQKQAREHKIN